MPSRQKRIRHSLTVQNTIILVVMIATLVSLIASSFFVQDYVIKKEYANAKDKMATTANIFAMNKEIIQLLESKDTKQRVQELSLDVATASQMDFIVVLDTDLIRLSHPDPSAIGKPFSNLEDAKKALLGENHFSTREGVLGDGLRYFTPIKNEQGQIIGVVCAGVTLKTIQSDIEKLQKIITVSIFIGLFVGILGAIFLAKAIKKVLFGLEPYEIAALISEKDIIHNEITEGIIAIDAKKRITIINDAAGLMLKEANITPESQLYDIISDNLFQLLFADVFETKKRQVDVDMMLNQIAIIANISPVFEKNHFHGAVMTFRDQSNMQDLVRTLSGTEQYIDAMRAQTHEFMNKAHVILGLVEQEQYDDVQKYIHKISNTYKQEFGYLTDMIKNPAIAGFLLGKINEAQEQDIKLVISPDSFLPNNITSDNLHQLLQILGNLIDNSIDSSRHAENKEIFLSLSYEKEGHILIIDITDYGTGIPQELYPIIFNKGISTKGEHRGFGLYFIHRIIEENGGLIDVSSNQPSGTSFYIELPLTTKQEES